MNEYKSPLNRSLFNGCAAFVIALSVLLSAQTHLELSSLLYEQYDQQLANVVNYLEKNIDAEDLSECIRTGVPSEKYVELQQLLNRMVDAFRLEYLYICIPVDDEAATMISVVSATDSEERAAGEEDYPLLYPLTGYYSAESLAPYLTAWDSDGISYFEEASEFGPCYTACKPLRTRDGETIALICADLSITGLRREVSSRVSANVLLTVGLCLAFGALLVVWLRRNVTGPILALEKSALRLAQMSRESKDADALSFEVSGVNTSNELKHLADAIAKLSQEMRHRVEDTAVAEARAQSAEQEIEGMFRVAYQDALTRVKNKAAYDAKTAELTVDIVNRRAAFAIVMMDLNNLKKVNDTYGHEHGNSYIIGACRIICTVFDHSPVYRIGGDEFIAVLEGYDYDERVDLYARLQAQLIASQEDEGREPWERFSAAVGMAVFDPAADLSVEDVFRRADRSMYDNKQKLKSKYAHARFE